MGKEKKYFKSIDHTFCSSLKGHLIDAKLDGLAEVSLIEAIPDNDNPDYIWCVSDGECVERYMCKKSLCESYESKSGRGKCENRGNLYQHGNEVNFPVPQDDI